MVDKVVSSEKSIFFYYMEIKIFKLTYFHVFSIACHIQTCLINIYF